MSDLYYASPVLSAEKSVKANGGVVDDLEEEELDPKSVEVDEVIAGALLLWSRMVRVPFSQSKSKDRRR